MTFRYSDAGICPYRTQAASQICLSKPIFAVFFITIYWPHFLYSTGIIIITVATPVSPGHPKLRQMPLRTKTGVPLAIANAPTKVRKSDAYLPSVAKAATRNIDLLVLPFLPKAHPGLSPATSPSTQSHQKKLSFFLALQLYYF